VTKADQKFIGVAVAACCAKVARDTFMVEAAQHYPEFEEIFRSGKGYYHSKKHTDLIEAGVFTDLHRKTYSHLKSFLDRQNKVITPRMAQVKKEPA
jgi:ribonuclease HII